MASINEPANFSDDNLRLLVSSIDAYAIFMLDLTGHIVTWNHGASRIKGYSAAEIVGEHYSRFYTDEDIEAGKPQRLLQLASEHGQVEDEGWRKRKDGTRIWVNVVITALRDASGTPVGFAKVTRDLTERRAAAEQLRASEERFRLLLEGIQDYAIYVLDRTGHVATWNTGAANIKGYTAAEIVGRHYSAFFTDAARLEARPEKELALALSAGRFEEEGYRVRKDGSSFWANVVLTPLRNGSGEHVGFAKITRDLTARREAEETARQLARTQAAREAAERAEVELRAEQERYKAAARAAAEAAAVAEEASRLKDDFLAVVSHELRTPLNAILGWATMLLSGATDARALKGLEVIQRNALAQARIIDDILDLSRIMAGKLKLDVQPVDITKVVRDAIEVTKPSAIANSIDIHFTPAGEHPGLMADPERLQQVIWNLLSNAVKFTERGGVITVRLRAVEGALIVTVSDTGRGISAEFLPFVFDRFRQAEGATTRRVGGLGLGLAIVRQIVELHGGRVEAQSAGLGAGTTFAVTLPLGLVPSVAAAPAEPQQVLAHVHRASGSLVGTRVLVVDDELDTRELIELRLQQEGAIVHTAGSAASAYAVMQEFTPQIIVSDIGMPIEDGYSLIRRIRALPAEAGGTVPAVALSAYARSADHSKALAAGYTLFIAKPVHPNDVVIALEQLLQGAAPSDEV